ncbi:MAG: class I SAM-dependent methyltransferase [Acidobacteria bacterium]|nr:class I SAM-dependent methyltransferase [Acidobacteriota bacterium]
MRRCFSTARFLFVILSLCVGAPRALAQNTQPLVDPPPSQTQQKPFEPVVGQAGKNVVWVPTPQALVNKMLDMAKVTPADFLMDLGSGDGRTVITAAKRGVKAMGIEYNPDMVALSIRNAAEAGVSDKATFVKADIFESDFSKATVITLFLLPDLNLRLRPKLLEMAPGTRVVSNSFRMEAWEPDQTETVSEDCVSWCTALLWIVPAKVEGTWQTAQGDLKLSQQFQMISGTLGSTPITGKLLGNDITVTAGNVQYSGKVNGNTMQGTVKGGQGGSWTATKR